jgi:hypothetical protein
MCAVAFVSLAARVLGRCTCMEIDVTLMPLCYKCDNRSIALGDGRRPLCSRHAMLFVTAPRILAVRDDSLASAGREPAATSPDDVSVVAAVTESTDRSLERIEDLVLDVEAAASGLGPSRDAAVDLVVTLHNKFHGVDEPPTTNLAFLDHRPRFGDEQFEAILQAV